MAKYPEGSVSPTGQYVVQGGKWVAVAEAQAQGPIAAPEWGDNAVRMPDGSIVATGPKGGRTVLKKADVGSEDVQMPEGKTKTAFNASRMTGALSYTEELEGTGFDPSLAKPGGATWQEDSRAYNAAASEWADAMIRQTTGAAATKEEVDRNVQTYFAQPGDTIRVRQQKAEMRKRVTRDLLSLGGSDVAKALPATKKSFAETESLKGMTPQQIKARAAHIKQFGGTGAKPGTARNPYIPRTAKEYQSIPEGAYYISEKGVFGQRNRSAAAQKAQGGGQFQNGKIYEDAGGNRARYVNGKWVPVK